MQLNANWCYSQFTGSNCIIRIQKGYGHSGKPEFRKQTVRSGNSFCALPV